MLKVSKYLKIKSLSLDFILFGSFVVVVFFLFNGRYVRYIKHYHTLGLCIGMNLTTRYISQDGCNDSMYRDILRYCM